MLSRNFWSGLEQEIKDEITFSKIYNTVHHRFFCFSLLPLLVLSSSAFPSSCECLTVSSISGCPFFLIFLLVLFPFFLISPLSFLFCSFSVFPSSCSVVIFSSPSAFFLSSDSICFSFLLFLL